MTTLLLDTNVLIRHLRKRTSVGGGLAQWGQHHDLSISVVTRTEILAGLFPREQAATLELLEALNCIPVNSRIADRAGRLIYELARRGVQLSFPDALIAATALELDLSVVTTNTAHFEPTGVQIQRWE